MTLLEKVIAKKIQLGCADREAALEDIALSVSQSSFYFVARMHCVLVEESGEEFAIEFMTAYNNEISLRY